MPYARVLGLEPTGAEAELDPTVRHLVDTGHRDRERTGEPERGRRDERAEADRRRVPGETGERGPCVARPGETGDVSHLEVVVAAEECTEPEAFGSCRDAEDVVVRRALLGLDEDAQVREIHRASVRRLAIN